MDEFIALDLETANSGMESVCQVGIAHFKNRKLVDEWSTLVDPEDYFDPINIGIHGIDKKAVLGAPKFPDIHETLKSYMTNHIYVTHTHFDNTAIDQAEYKYDIFPHIKGTWLDSAKVARRIWPQCAKKGYGLADVCKIIGYDFKHHDALEDAKASGQIIIEAMNISGLDIPWLIDRTRKPISPETASTGSAINREGNQEGPLYGEVIVFTGSLTIHRNEAADIAAAAGCQVESNVKKNTTLLVVGDQDLDKLAGKEKSRKHLKAEELIMKGQTIRILKESDFISLVDADYITKKRSHAKRNNRGLSVTIDGSGITFDY